MEERGPCSVRYLWCPQPSAVQARILDRGVRVARHASTTLVVSMRLPDSPPRPAPPSLHRMGPKVRRRSAASRLMMAIGLILALLNLLIAAYLLLSARALLNDGVNQMNLVQSRLGVANNAVSADTAVGAAIPFVDQAHRDFAEADRRLTPLRPMLDHLGWVPSVGDQLVAAGPSANLASTTSEGVAVLLRGIHPVIHAARKPANGRMLARLSPAIASRSANFGRAYALFSSAVRIRRSMAQQPPAQLASALRTLDVQLPRLRAASLALALAPQLLGVTSPRTYLIAYQDETELRATGGFIGAINLVTVRRGTVRQHFEGTEIGNRERLLVPAPEPIRAYNEIWWLMRDSNWSPNFPTTAALERYFLRMDLGVNPWGVIDVTSQAAASVLAATGPLYVPEYHRWVTAGNVARLADYYTHVAYTPGSTDTVRKEFIAVVGSHLVTRIQSLDLQGWLRLSAGLEDAAVRGDLLINLPGTHEHQLVRLLGTAGAISSTTSDYLYVVQTNLSYNKINPYIHTSIRYAVTIRPDRWLEAALSIRLRNDLPPTSHPNLNWFGPGGGRLANRDDYADYLRIYVPPGSQLTDQSGWKNPWTPGPAYGKTEFSGYVIVRRGHSATIHLRYLMPPNALSWSGGKRYRLVVQHQPGSHPEAWDVSVRDAIGADRTWRKVRPDRAWTIEAPIEPRVLQPIPLPRQLPAVVAPGHWIEPHAYLQGPHV